jgi:hypothetical protein
MQCDMDNATKDKQLAKDLSGISDVSNYSFVRKSYTPQSGKKTGKKKETLADKRKAAGKVPGAKPARKAKEK